MNKFNPIVKLSNSALRFTPIILLIVYFGAIDRINLFNEEIRFYILILFIFISAIAAAILYFRRELKSEKLIVLLAALIVSFLIFAFAL